MLMLFPPGRSPEFLTGSWQYTLALFTAAARINMLPQWLRPIAAPWLTATTKKHFAGCLKAAEPVIRKRLAEIQNDKTSGSSNSIHVILPLYRSLARIMLTNCYLERRIAMGH